MTQFSEENTRVSFHMTGLDIQGHLKQQNSKEKFRKIRPYLN